MPPTAPAVFKIPTESPQLARGKAARPARAKAGRPVAGRALANGAAASTAGGLDAPAFGPILLPMP
jgi:hypothetical protein